MIKLGSKVPAAPRLLDSVDATGAGTAVTDVEISGITSGTDGGAGDGISALQAEILNNPTMSHR
jgi:hypothetical protein